MTNEASGTEEREEIEGAVEAKPEEGSDGRKTARAQSASRIESEPESKADEKPKAEAASGGSASLRGAGGESEEEDEAEAEEEPEAEAEAEGAESDQDHDQEDDHEDVDVEEEDEGPEQILDLPEYDDVIEQGAEWLEGLFERMEVRAEAEIVWEDDHLQVNISGPQAEQLLGPGRLGPKAIEGIETLLQSVFSEDADIGGIYVDVGGKRAGRKKMLQETAEEMADTAIRLDKAMTFSGLNSTERRIIHRQLRDNNEVDTESVGDGIFRRLRIEPNG